MLPIVEVAKIATGESESVEARHLVSHLVRENLGIHNFTCMKNQDGSPNWDEVFWSVAYKDGWIAAAIGSGPLGIDLELRTEPTPDLIESVPEYMWEIVGGKTIDNFLYSGPVQKA